MLLVIKAPPIQAAVGKSSAEESVRGQAEQLTSAMQRGDEDAYREFFRLYFHRLLAYLLVVTRGDEELARDLVQQTMIKVAKHIRTFENEDILWRWVTLLARTAAVDHGRKLQRYFGFLQKFWAFRSAPPPAPPGEELVFEEALARGLELLEPGDRSLIEKKYFDELSVREIAMELNLTEKAVESRLTRVRARLKQELLERLHHE